MPDQAQEVSETLETQLKTFIHEKVKLDAQHSLLQEELHFAEKTEAAATRALKFTSYRVAEAAEAVATTEARIAGIQQRLQKQTAERLAEEARTKRKTELGEITPDEFRTGADLVINDIDAFNALRTLAFDSGKTKAADHAKLCGVLFRALYGHDITWYRSSARQIMSVLGVTGLGQTYSGTRKKYKASDFIETVVKEKHATLKRGAADESSEGEESRKVRVISVVDDTTDETRAEKTPYSTRGATWSSKRVYHNDDDDDLYRSRSTHGTKEFI